ncbi:MAG: hypothetical protein ABI873_01955 [Marmoricola sp.]
MKAEHATNAKPDTLQPGPEPTMVSQRSLIVTTRLSWSPGTLTFSNGASNDVATQIRDVTGSRLSHEPRVTRTRPPAGVVAR